MKRLTLIRDTVAESFGLKPQALHRHTRAAKIVWPRMICMWLSREFRLPTVPTAAFWRCHTVNVARAARVVRARIETENHERVRCYTLKRLLERL